MEAEQAWEDFAHAYGEGSFVVVSPQVQLLAMLVIVGHWALLRRDVGVEEAPQGWVHVSVESWTLEVNAEKGAQLETQLETPMPRLAVLMEAM